MKVHKTKFKGEESMRKYSKRLLALLLACIMVLACGVTAFASDEGLVERTKTPAPKTWATTMDYPEGDEHFYYNISKVTIPCKGTLKILMVSSDGSTYDDEYGGPGGENFKEGYSCIRQNRLTGKILSIIKSLVLAEKQRLLMRSH